MNAPRPEGGVPLAWAPEADWIAFAATPAVVTVARVVATQDPPSTTLVGHLTMREPVQSLSVSRDGRWLAAGHPEGGVSVHAVDLEAPGAWREVSRGSVPLWFGPTHDSAAPTLVEFSPVEDTLAVVCGRLVSWIRVDPDALDAARIAPEPVVQEKRDREEAPALCILRVRTDDREWVFDTILRDGLVLGTSRLRRSPELDVRSMLGLDDGIVPGLRAMSPATASAIVAAQELLIPPGVLDDSPLAREQGPLVLQLDPGVEILPWELLLRDSSGSPWAVTRGIVRRPSSRFAPRKPRPERALALVVTVPSSDLSFEGRGADRLEHGSGNRVLHVEPSRRRLREVLEADLPRLVAIFGAVDVRDRPSADRALYLAPGEEPLTPGDFATAAPPGLVFIGHPYTSDWSALLEHGVRAVVTLDWRIDPEGARAFTDEFMRSFAGGATLIEASRMARQYAYTRHPESSAWAAYRCHGDPFYRLSSGDELVAEAAPAVPVDLSPIAPPSTSPEPVRVTATPGQDMVMLDVQDGPRLVLHPETAKDLMAAQSGERPAARTPAGAGFLGTVLLKTLQIITGVDGAADPVRLGQLAARVDEAHPKGLFELSSSGWPPTPRPVATFPAGDAVTLVLVHGLMSSGPETFGSMASEQRLFDRHAGRVLSLEHATLTADPLDAALQLARACAPGARLHLLTHSSGGLVAEALVRATAEDAAGGDASDLDHDGLADEAWRQRTAELAALVRERRLRVERVVRVACPTHGTLLASGHLDAFLSVFAWAQKLAGIEATAARTDLLAHVALARSDASVLPGFAALGPESALVRWVNGGQAAVPGDLRIVAGDLKGGSAASWVKTLLSDAYYWSDNDLIVQTRSMFGGVPRERGATFFLDSSGEASHFNYFRHAETVRAIVDALLLDQPSGFAPVGTLSWSGQSPSGDR